MRKLHLDNEIVLYRIHSDLVEFRQNGKKTLITHNEVYRILGLPQYQPEDDGKEPITPGMLKSYLSILAGFAQAKNGQLVDGPDLS
jgi:hypothetical protein